MMLKDRAGSGRPRNWGREGKRCIIQFIYTTIMHKNGLGRERVCKKGQTRENLPPVLNISKFCLYSCIHALPLDTRTANSIVN